MQQEEAAAKEANGDCYRHGDNLIAHSSFVVEKLSQKFCNTIFCNEMSRIGYQN